MSRASFPSFEQTLAAGIAPSRTTSFDATIGREDVADVAIGATLAAIASRPLALPTVSIALGETGARDESATDTDLIVVRKLGEGGMGVVHLAEQRSLDRVVAVKTTRLDATDSTRAALCDEAVVTGRLEHPNVVPVHAFGRTHDGRPVMVMKRIEGVSWRDLLRDPAHPQWETPGADRLVEHLEILIQVSNALSFAHARSVVHRDVKPENVHVGSFGEVVLLDFGLAVRLDRQQAAAHSIVGTPAYLAPEMVAGMPVDQRTDVYLLGACLHEILVGRPPHDGETLMDVLSCAYTSSAPVYPEGVPEELGSIAARAMRRDPTDRFEDVRAFRAALREYLRHRASHASTERGRERLVASRALPPTERRAALADARTALLRALDEWSENDRARALVRDVALARCELEINAHNAEAAAAELAEVDEPPEALVRSLSALREQLAREREAASKLDAIEKDLDQRVGAPERSRALLAMAATSLCIAVAVTRFRARDELEPHHLVIVAAGMCVLVGTMLLVFVRRLSQNLVSRRLSLIAWMSTWALILHRLFAWHAGLPVPTTLAGDQVMLTIMVLVTAIAFDLRFLVAAPLGLVGAALCVEYPQHATSFFSGTTSLSLLIGAFYFRHVGREPPT